MLITRFIPVLVLAFGALLAFGAPVAAQSPTSVPAIVGTRVLATEQRARLVVDLTGPVDYRVTALSGPDRIMVDLKVGGLADAPLRQPAGGAGRVVTAYAIRPAENGLARIELTLGQPAQVQQAYLLDAFADQPARLVVDLIPDSADNFARTVAEDQARLSAGEPATAATPPPPSGARPLIVIDPGHGGIDTGAIANGGVREKDLVLAFALHLQDLLVETGRFDVAMTRDGDSFLKLEERVTLARQNKADLFISIHADTFDQSEIQGASIYTRDENATDVLDKVLAEAENKSDLVAGFTLPSAPPAVVDILVDLMRRETRRQSYAVAAMLLDHLEPAVRLRRYPQRQADFFVLQAPDVPSVLLELGFLSNDNDIRNLSNTDWQTRTAEALVRGIGAYFDSQQAMAAN